MLWSELTYACPYGHPDYESNITWFSGTPPWNHFPSKFAFRIFLFPCGCAFSPNQACNIQPRGQSAWGCGRSATALLQPLQDRGSSVVATCRLTSSSLPIPVCRIEVAHRPPPTPRPLPHSLSLGSLSLSLPTPWATFERPPLHRPNPRIPPMDFKSTATEARPPP